MVHLKLTLRKYLFLAICLCILVYIGCYIFGIGRISEPSASDLIKSGDLTVEMEDLNVILSNPPVNKAQDSE